MPGLVDSHCHFDFSPLALQAETLLQALAAQEIEKVVVPGVSAARWATQRQICDASPMLVAAYGLHPYFLAEHQPQDVERLAEQLQQAPVCAIGEIGLDFYLPDLDRERQLDYCQRQLQLAQQQDLPVILHARKSHDQLLQLLRRYPLARGGVVHAFNGSLQQAEQYMALGFYLGFGGAMTYPRARKLRHLAQSLPLSGLLLETDAPDMLPYNCQPPNTPLNLPMIAQTLAQLRQQPVDEIVAQTTYNARRLWAWPE